MELFLTILAIAFGAQFILFGVDGFFHFLPMPKAPEKLMKFGMAMQETRYLMTTIKIIEMVAGLGCFFPKTRLLALLMLAPIIYNVMGVHIVFNFRKSWIMFLQVLLPYLILLAAEYGKLERLFTEIIS